MPLKSRILIAASFIAIFAQATPKDSASITQLTPGQKLAMESEFPGSEIVSPTNIDRKSCTPTPDSPSYVSEDFDGNGHTDFSVLAAIGTPGESVEWNGQQLRHQRFVFAIFLADSAGNYRRRLAKEFDSYKPLAAVLKLQGPGKVVNRDNGKTSTLDHPAVILSFCEKSAAVFFYSREKFRSIQLVD